MLVERAVEWQIGVAKLQLRLSQSGAGQGGSVGLKRDGRM